MTDTQKKYTVTVNGFTFAFTQSDIAAADIVAISPTEFNCINDHTSVNAKLVSTGNFNKSQQIEIAGTLYDVTIKDELDQVLDKMGLNNTTAKQIKVIKAPMPGLVLEIAVTEGQEVKEGDKILILEAMKMENSLLIHANAKIKKVAVTPGQAVEKGQVLVELE